MYGMSKQRRMVNLQRHREEVRRDHAAEIRKENVIKDRANWEQKTTRALERNMIYGTVQEQKTRREKDLEARRKRLAVLFEQENAAYKKALDDLQETSEMKRDRLLAKAKQMKEDMESHRQKFVAEASERRFRDGCDEIRTNKGTRMLQECRKIQAGQLEERKKISAEEKMLEKKYAADWADDLRRKNENAARGVEVKKRLLQETTAGVKAQMQEAEDRRNLEKMRQDEAQKLRLRLEAEHQEYEAEAKRIEAKILAQKREEAMRSTKEAQNRRLAAKERDRSEAKEYIDQVMAHEKATLIHEQDERQENRRDIEDYMQYLDDLRAARAEQERQLDKLRESDLKAEHDKRDQQLGREDQARQNLQDQVYMERGNQIAWKKEYARREKNQDFGARAKLTKEIEIERARQEEEDLRDRMERVKIQEFQKQQMGERSTDLASKKLKLEKARLELEKEESEYNAKVDQLQKEDAARGTESFNYPLKRMIT